MAEVSGSKQKPKKKRSDAAQDEKNAMELAAAGQLPAGRRAAAKKAKKLPGSIIALEEKEEAEPQPDRWVEEDDDSMLASVLAKQLVLKKPNNFQSAAWNKAWSLLWSLGHFSSNW